MSKKDKLVFFLYIPLYVGTITIANLLIYLVTRNMPISTFREGAIILAALIIAVNLFRVVSIGSAVIISFLWIIVILIWCLEKLFAANE